jgi:putative ABC transport system permease protein
MLSFLMESILLAAIGGMLGCLISLSLNGLAAGTTNFTSFSEIMFYFAVTPDLMVKGLVFGVIMGTLGGLIPAISAARQPIIKTLREN